MFLNLNTFTCKVFLVNLLQGSLVGLLFSINGTILQVLLVTSDFGALYVHVLYSFLHHLLVTFSSTIGKEFFLGGGSGPWLVEGSANSVPGVAMLLSNEVNLVSSACNLLVIKVLILGVSNFLSLNIYTTGLKPLNLE